MYESWVVAACPLLNCGPYTCGENGFLLFFHPPLIPPSLFLSLPLPFSLWTIQPFSLSLSLSLSLSFNSFTFSLCTSLSSVPCVSDNVIFQLLSPERECHCTFKACSPLVFITLSPGCTLSLARTTPPCTTTHTRIDTVDQQCFLESTDNGQNPGFYMNIIMFQL